MPRVRCFFRCFLCRPVFRRCCGICYRTLFTLINAFPRVASSSLCFYRHVCRGAMSGAGLLPSPPGTRQSHSALPMGRAARGDPCRCPRAAARHGVPQLSTWCFLLMCSGAMRGTPTLAAPGALGGGGGLPRRHLASRARWYHTPVTRGSTRQLVAYPGDTWRHTPGNGLPQRYLPCKGGGGGG